MEETASSSPESCGRETTLELSPALREKRPRFPRNPRHEAFDLHIAEQYGTKG